jgi:hypothetical protein
MGKVCEGRIPQAVGRGAFRSMDINTSVDKHFNKRFIIAPG